MALYRLLYHSKASQKMKDSEIFSIIEKAQENNKQLNVTGLLLYIDDGFIQCLEGEEEVVKDLYRKISNDDRHEQARVVLQGNIKERDFDSWNMGLKIFTGQDILDLKQMNQNEEFDLLTDLAEKSNLAIELMRFFYKNGKIDFTKFWNSQNNISIKVA